MIPAYAQFFRYSLINLLIGALLAGPLKKVQEGVNEQQLCCLGQEQALLVKHKGLKMYINCLHILVLCQLGYLPNSLLS